MFAALATRLRSQLLLRGERGRSPPVSRRSGLATHILLGGACPATRTALPALVQNLGVRGLWLSCGRETTAVRHDTAQRMARVQITRRVLPLNTLAQQIVHVLPAHAPHTVWTRVHPHAHYHKRPFASSLQSGAQAGTRPHMEVYFIRQA